MCFRCSPVDGCELWQLLQVTVPEAQLGEADWKLLPNCALLWQYVLEQVAEAYPALKFVSSHFRLPLGAAELVSSTLTVPLSCSCVLRA